MLKVLPNSALGGSANAKCGEIFCQSSSSFTIVCTFCEMKTFEFEDFLLHFKNVHFENNLLKTEEVDLECAPYIGMNIKSELENGEEVNERESSDILGDLGLMHDTERALGFDKDSSTNENDTEWKEDNNSEDSEEEYKPKKPALHIESKTFECEFCKEVYKTKAVLKHHISRYHSGKETSAVQTCNQCSAEFPTVRQFTAHMLKEHLGFPCSECGKKFSANYELKRHAIKHTGVKNFVCDTENCGKRFFTRRQLNIHRRIHLGIKNYICEACAYSCRTKEMLKVHYRTHTGEKPYACDICNKKFRSSSLVREHKAIHSTERPHVCEVCNAAFSRPKALYHHKHLHLGIKKFVCKLCGNAYAQAAGLAGHMRQHRAEQF